MNFKKLEVYGFKSFADKLTVEFAPGITAIVGPNGCGKSNVSDAIRWALGEQGPRQLRGNQMVDVIFKGTETRKSMSYCEVALHFDNTDRMFDCEYDEVVISRKLYRSLESVYSINKQEVRLRDIVALLHGTGLGRDSYSIIGQGRIDEILSAKAEDRRAIFEEAAGIGSYKQTKLENERRLERINERLTRLIDITTEQERQLGPLAKQAENARIAFDLRDKLRVLEVNSFLYQHDTAESRKETVRQRIAAIDEETAQRVAEYDSANAEYTASMEELEGIDGTLREKQNTRLTIRLNLERRAGELRVMQQRVASLREQNTLLQEEIDRNAEAMRECERQIRSQSELKNRRKDEIAAASAEIKRLSEAYIAVCDKLMAYEESAERSHREMIDSINKLNALAVEASASRAERSALAERLAELQADGEADAKRATSVGDELARANAEADRLDAQVKAETDALQAANATYNECLAGIRDLAARIDRASAALVKLQERSKFLEDLANNLQGYAYSVQRLVRDAKSDPALGKRIEGHIAALMRVRKGMEIAIETALGNSIQNIVVPTEEDAKYLIEYLKRNRFGRATFLPLTAVRGHKLETPYERVTGALGIASDLVSYDEKYRAVFEMLLGRTLVVDTLDTAISIARRAGFAFRIVTLEGDIINPQGAMTGGSTRSEVGNILTAERELGEIKGKLAEAERDLKALTDERSALAEKQEKAMAAIRAHTDGRRTAELAATRVREHAEQIRAEAESAATVVAERTAAIEKLRERIGALDKRSEGAAEAEHSLTRGGSDAVGLRDDEYLAAKAERETLQNTITAKKVALASAETEVESLGGEIDRMRSDCLAYEAAIEERKIKIAENLREIEKNDVDNVVVMDETDDELRERLAAVEREMGALDTRKTVLRERIAELDVSRTASQNALQELSARRAKREADIEKIDQEVQFYGNRIAEAYDLTYETCLQYRVDDFDDTEAPAEINRLRRELNRLGNINMHAIEDYNELKARYDEQMLARADLEKSVEDVKAVIADMTHEMLTRFTTQFERIRVNFVQCFKSLFGGGNADLILEEGDPLEAGIGILAEPPGKKLQSILLLSGGERALTAIAILFAILMLRPMPFCVLDEIEAALDDANVERFAKYLHNFSQNTQFIVITHRKPTMALADSLYGVTMEEKGVSKIVSVKLSEAVKVADTQE